MTDNPFFVKLENRGLVKVSGTDRFDFLQGLITNDIGLLKTQPCLYACLLTPQGKFLHDFFITEKGDELRLDCEGGARAEDLAKRLSVYKLRSAVEISCQPETEIYAVFHDKSCGHPDPRHPDMGQRAFEKPDLPQEAFSIWNEHRIRLCLPNGSRDMEVGASTLLECNIDKLHGISLSKGCYIGQELTARMHYRGLAKKHLYAIEGALPPPGSEIRSSDDKLIGTMRSSCDNIGLALLKDGEITLLKKTGLKII